MMKEFDKDLDEVLATDDKGSNYDQERLLAQQDTLILCFMRKCFFFNKSIIADIKVSPKDRQKIYTQMLSFLKAWFP